MKQIFKNKNILTILISCVIVFILFVTSSFFHVLNKSLQNKYYAVKNEILQLGASPHIIVVELDEKSLDTIGTFPFSRGVYADILRNIQFYNPAVIALDILFLDPSDAVGDIDFIRALRESDNVVLGSAFDSDKNMYSLFPALAGENPDAGFLAPNVNASNRTVYSFSPKIYTADGESHEHFGIRVFRAFQNTLYNSRDISVGTLDNNNYILNEYTKFPLAQNNSDEILINFIPSNLFTRISLSDLYQKESLLELAKTIDFQDTIILIGPAAEGFKDEFFTPQGLEYGVYVHANILNTLLSREFMIYFDRKLEWLMIFFLIILSVSANLSYSNKTLFLSNITIMFIFWFFIPIFILLGTNLILNYPSEIILSLLLAFSSANIVKYAIEDANKQKLNKALGEYVSTRIAHEILEGHGEVNLDGEKRKLVCFFSDIEGFTHLSEKLAPEDLVSFLRKYLGKMTSIIMDQGGHVDKFEGDAVMAFWGAFRKHSEDDYMRACESALLQQIELDTLNREYSNKFESNVRVRMGIHGGDAIVGNIGAEGKKMEFTALGDNINIASRLEGVNKYYGSYICVSDVVYQACQEKYFFRTLDLIQVQGKEIPVKIYELIGKKGDITKKQLKVYSEFERALLLYKKQKFIEAQVIFKRLSELGDPPSHTYLTRTNEYIKNPPKTEDWNGIWKMQGK